MNKTKWLSVILGLSIVLNIWFVVQYITLRDISKQANETVEYATNIALSRIKAFVSYTQNEDFDWDNTMNRSIVYNDLMMIQRTTFSIQSLVNLKDEDLSQIAYNLVRFGGTLDPYMDVLIESIEKEQPLSKGDLERIRNLGEKLNAAGFTKQFHEDNGNDLKRSLESYLDN